MPSMFYFLVRPALDVLRPIQVKSGLLTSLKLLSRLLPPPQGESPTGRAPARTSALRANPTGHQRRQQAQ